MWTDTPFEDIEEARDYCRACGRWAGNYYREGFTAFSVRSPEGMLVLAQREDGTGPVKQANFSAVHRPARITPDLPWRKLSPGVDWMQLGQPLIEGEFVAYAGKEGVHEYLSLSGGDVYHRILMG